MDRIGIPYRAVVEPQEFDAYAAVVDPSRLMVLPHRDRGLVVTRNWIWDHARDAGYQRFWTFDDNIKRFCRFNRNLMVPILDGTFLRVIEDFADRYVNLPVAGMQYEMFAPTKRNTYVPVHLNTRVYSNMLIQTDAVDPRGKPYRNEGFYNDDTDLCLRILKDGNCTALFYAFTAKKLTTMRVEGGMTPHYLGDGRYRMAKELRDKHPDVVKITRKWGRWQHQVDYRPFKNNKLIRKSGVVIPQGVNNYGMVLRSSKQ